MKNPIKKRKKRAHSLNAKLGTVPGTMVFIGDQKMDKVCIDIINYSESMLQELPGLSVDQCRELIKSPGVTWINVNGIHDVGLIGKLGKHLGLHPLTLENIVNTEQRPKTEEFPDYIYTVLKMISLDEESKRMEIEHVSLILGKNYVLSFQEKEGDVFNPVRERLKNAIGRIRTMKSDYLAYSLMDAVVDNYFLTVERIGDRIEDLDDQILTEPEPGNMQELHHLKRDILYLRKIVWPLREEVGRLDKSESPLIHPETKVFFRDLYDHTIQVIDIVETFRDILGGMHDTYLSSVSNRMNEIMKMLTIFATIFIPLTFITGVYGMNFEFMPELKWHWGYFLVLGLMLVLGLVIVRYFRKKKWL